MVSDKLEVGQASQADLAADMEHYRATYGNFFRIIVYSTMALAVLMLILFAALKERGSFPVT